MDRASILRSSVQSRDAEISEYQLNIDNYRLALDMISKMSEEEREWMKPFVDQLNELLSSSLFEQKKAMIMRDVVLHQLGEK